MKILHVITTIEKGGAENQLVTLVKYQVESGHAVQIMYLKGRPELLHSLQEIGATVVVKKRNFSLLKQFKLFRTNNYEIVHAHLPQAELYAAFFKKVGVKLIVTKHNTEQFYPNSPRLLSGILARFVYRRSDAVICISEAVKAFLQEICELPFIESKTYVVHYGYNALPEPLETSKKARMVEIGCIARLVPQKDLQTLISAFAINYASHPNILLKIYGEGPERNQLQKKIYELGLENVVTLPGKVLDIDQKIRKFDFLVLPSKYEGFGLVLLEAMSASVPIIAAANSAILEVLGHEYTYLFETSNVIDLSDKIKRMLKASDHVETISYLNQRLKLFDPVLMSRKIEKIYEA